MSEPVLRIVRGIPDGTDASRDVAVLTAVLSRRSAEPSGEAAPTSTWAARDRLLRAPMAPGIDGWRASALPR